MKKYLLLLLFLLCLISPVNASAEHFYLNESNNGDELFVQEGQSLELALDSNSSTGYSWIYQAEPDTNIMEMTGHGYQDKQAIEAPTIVGAGGKEHWFYKASRPGTTTISLCYARPWESKMPEKTFTVKVNVLPQVKVLFDQKVLEFDVPPIIENGYALVPLRAIFEAAGAKVDWLPETQTVVATKDNTIVKFTVGNDIAYINGTDVKLEAPSQIIGNRTMVPLQFIGEALGYKVEWDNNNNTINICL
ncbi:MAG: hypothetical protein A4E55_01246 [Pelotomaculum sp. PtaU1.Bin035]|nr:MAG: hypothetical protein A4E55_01246 [Pelotomaculum sp. PtaU1.Bin035]